MSQAIAISHSTRINNYAHQDDVTHNFISRNCPTYMTAAQKRRVNKKMRLASKRAVASGSVIHFFKGENK